jgi:two-component system, cell cycle sensor histidine kinase and response regulator CckA
MTRESRIPAPDQNAEFRQRKLIQKAKLEALIAMAAGIAHDFNNPLTAILGNNSIVLRHLSAQSPARKNATQIEASALQALELAGQIQIFTGRGRPNAVLLNLSDAIRGMEAELKALLTANVTMELRLDASVPAVKADLQQIRRVVMNLFMNANDAMADRKGAIVVATGVMNSDKAVIDGCHGADSMKEGRYAFLAISDPGGGMTQEVQGRIFDPFFSTKIRGKGLGLPVVWGIVRAHGGGIMVESEPNKGSTFRVLLPAV